MTSGRESNKKYEWRFVENQPADSDTPKAPASDVGATVDSDENKRKKDDDSFRNDGFLRPGDRVQDKVEGKAKLVTTRK